MEWMDWKATLIYFLKYQPGRNGVPLNYVIREKIYAIVRTNKNFIDDYVDRKPLTGRVFNDNFNKCVDIKSYELEDNWKTYSGLTVTKGRIRIRPRTKVNIR